nr:hypothetical protein [Tanacetum cinerariifolium]
MLLYIKGKEHGKLLVDSVLNRPFQYRTIVEPANETTLATVTAQTYTDLTDEEKIRESVDIKATNIFLQVGMTMKPLQVNKKFVNHLQPEWSKFVTDVKLAKDMHYANFYYLYAHLGQHEAHTNEVLLQKQRYPDQIALAANSLSYLKPTQYYP